MALAFRRQTIDIPSGTRRRSINGTASFSSNVRIADVAINGFKLDYVNSDHHINVIEVDMDVINISGSDVEFRVECQYADVNFDDLYTGSVEVLIIADVR